MVKYTTTQVTFREFPDEVTLCLNLSNCPHHCHGCHSPELRGDIGIELTDDELRRLIEENPGITCVGFMGDTKDISRINELAFVVSYEYKLKVGWYSGYDIIHPDIIPTLFNYIKIGHYDENRGSLDNPNTNQRMFRITCEEITNKFWKNASTI